MKHKNHRTKVRIAALSLGLALGLSLQAQSTLSLDSCRALALRGNKELAIGQAKAQQAQWNRKAAYTNYLPKVSVTAGYMRTGDEISLLSKDQKNASTPSGQQA